MATKKTTTKQKLNEYYEISLRWDIPTFSPMKEDKSSLIPNVNVLTRYRSKRDKEPNWLEMSDDSELDGTTFHGDYEEPYLCFRMMAKDKDQLKTAKKLLVEKFDSVIDEFTKTIRQKLEFASKSVKSQMDIAELDFMDIAAAASKMKRGLKVSRTKWFDGSKFSSYWYIEKGMVMEHNNETGVEESKMPYRDFLNSLAFFMGVGEKDWVVVEG